PDRHLRLAGGLTLKFWRISACILKSRRTRHADQFFHGSGDDSGAEVLPVENVLAHFDTIRVLASFDRPALFSRFCDQSRLRHNGLRSHLCANVYSTRKLDLCRDGGAHRRKLVHVLNWACANSTSTPNHTHTRASATTTSAAVSGIGPNICRAAEDDQPRRSIQVIAILSPQEGVARRCEQSRGLALAEYGTSGQLVAPFEMALRIGHRAAIALPRHNALAV